MPFFFLVGFIIAANVLGSGVVLAAVPAKSTKAAAAKINQPTKSAAAELKSTPSDVPDAAIKPTPVPPSKEGKSISVTRVVGEAGPRIVTSREVRMNEAIGQVLTPPLAASVGADTKPVELKKRILDMEDPAFPAQVLKVLDEWTVFLEATVIGSKLADKSEVARLTKLVTDYWKGFSDWDRLEVSPSEIKEIIERKLAAQSLEHLKGDSSLVNVSDTEALQYFKKNRLRFGNLPFENFKDGIKAALIRSQTERRLTEWRAVLRKKYRVRNFVGA